MIIANPIYDVVFKRLMEDKRVACFFIETLTGETIADIELKPQEFTFYKELEMAESKTQIEAIKDKMYGLLGLAVYRLDFIATIKIPDNEYKKVLIEIQKARNPVDLMRFRSYLAEQYKKEDEVNTEKGKVKMALPIITIYLLGFALNEINAPVIKVNRQYIDVINNLIIEQKSEFIEKLTHDSYVVQIPKVQPRVQSKLEALLTVFEQSHFTDETEITKNYLYPVNDEILKNIINILHHTGTDPKERIEIEKEQEAMRIFDLGMRELKQAIVQKEEIIVQKEEIIVQKEEIIVQKEEIIVQKEEIIAQKDKALFEQEKLIEELKRKLGE